MARKRPAICSVCGRTEREVGRISLTGKCVECGTLIQLESVNQIRNREGPIYENWLEGFRQWADRSLSAARDKPPE